MIVHGSDEAVFQTTTKSSGGSLTHLRVGAVNVNGSVLYRTEQHALFAAAAVAVQKENRFWFEEKYLSNSSFHIVFPSHGRYDSSYQYPTRHLQKVSFRCDPIVFLLRRGDAVFFLDASSMQEKDRLEINNAFDQRMWSEKDSCWHDLHEYLQDGQRDRFTKMTIEEKADRADRWSGQDQDLITYSAESSLGLFNLNPDITIQARKIMVDGVHPFLPLGWCLATTIRQAGESSGRQDDYYFSPRGYMFRSRPEVERFLRCLKCCGKKEVMAKAAFDNGRCRI